VICPPFSPLFRPDRKSRDGAGRTTPARQDRTKPRADDLSSADPEYRWLK